MWNYFIESNTMKNIFTLILILIFAGCKSPYEPLGKIIEQSELHEIDNYCYDVDVNDNTIIVAASEGGYHKFSYAPDEEGFIEVTSIGNENNFNPDYGNGSIDRVILSQINHEHPINGDYNLIYMLDKYTGGYSDVWFDTAQGLTVDPDFFNDNCYQSKYLDIMLDESQSAGGLVDNGVVLYSLMKHTELNENSDDDDFLSYSTSIVKRHLTISPGITTDAMISAEPCEFLYSLSYDSKELHLSDNYLAVASESDGISIFEKGSDGRLYALGDGVWNDAESFEDSNDNGDYDIGESFTDQNGNGQWDDAEEWQDDYFNNIYDEGEEFTDCGVWYICDEDDAENDFCTIDNIGAECGENGECIEEAICDGDDNWDSSYGNGEWDENEIFSDAPNGIYDEGEENFFDTLTSFNRAGGQAQTVYVLDNAVIGGFSNDKGCYMALLDSSDNIITNYVSFADGYSVKGIDVEGTIIGIATGNDGVQLYEWYGGNTVSPYGSFDTDGYAYDLKIKEDLIFVATRSGLEIYKIGM